MTEKSFPEVTAEFVDWLKASNHDARPGGFIGSVFVTLDILDSTFIERARKAVHFISSGRYEIAEYSVVASGDRVRICFRIYIHFETALDRLVSAARSALFSFEGIRRKESYERALSEFCRSKRMIRQALNDIRKEGVL